MSRKTQLNFSDIKLTKILRIIFLGRNHQYQFRRERQMRFGLGSETYYVQQTIEEREMVSKINKIYAKKS